MKKGLFVAVAFAVAASFVDAGPFGVFPLLRRPGNVCGSGDSGAPLKEPLHSTQRLDPQTFAGALQKQLLMKEKLTFRERRILDIINSPHSAKRDRVLYRMELAARGALDIHANEAVNWGEVDWPRVIRIILAILVELLPLLI